MIKRNYPNLIRFLAVSLVFVLSFICMPVYASALTSTSDTLSRLKAGETANHTIKFTTPTGIAIGNEVTLTFPESSFSMGASLSGVTITDGAGTPGVVASASWSTPTLTITADADSTVAAGHVATISIPNTQITNPATGTYVVTIGGSFGDTGSFAVYITSTNDDQVVVTASVDPSITFSLSAAASTFGILSPGVVKTGGTVITLTVGTNANGGYSISVRDTGSGANPGLWSSAASSLIGSADGSYNATGDLASVPLGFGIQAACTAGCTTNTDVASDFRQGASVVGGITLAAKNLATYANSTASDHTITNTYKAKASASTKAGSYSDTLTYIATATF